MQPHRRLRRAGSGRADRGPRLGLEPLERRDCPAAVLGLTVREAVVFEGERVDVTLTLSQPATATERVAVTTRAISATYGVDYFAPLTHQVTFAPGQTSQTIAIQTLRDAPKDATEGTEYFTIQATPATPALGVRAVNVGIADYAPPPTLSVTDMRMNEGNSGTSTMTFMVGLSGRYAKPVTVSYATRDGSATTANDDYVPASGSLVFAPGETTKAVVVTINGDRILEPDETFSLVLTSPRNATLTKPTGIGTIVNDERDQPGFQVTLNYLDGPGGPVPQSVRTVAQQAVNRWARIITGDLAAVTDNGFIIDDFEMSVQMGLLGGAPSDGPSNVLANAGPTAFRDNGNGLPYKGITGLDPADIANTSLLLDTITHEMGHAFGFLRGPAVFSRWVVGDTFVGPNALREYNSIFATSATGVPLQAGGGHWDETVFGNELMSPVTTGAPEYISRITIGALNDMGYTVNYAAAEPYVRPRVMAPQVAAATGVATVSAFPSGSAPTASNKPSQSVVQAKPPVVVVQTASVKAATVSKVDAAKAVAVAESTAGTAKAVPPKSAYRVALLSQAGIGVG